MAHGRGAASTLLLAPTSSFAEQRLPPRTPWGSSDFSCFPVCAVTSV